MKSHSIWNILPELYRTLLDNEIIEDATLEKFQLTRELKNGD